MDSRPVADFMTTLVLLVESLFKCEEFNDFLLQPAPHFNRLCLRQMNLELLDLICFLCLSVSQLNFCQVYAVKIDFINLASHVLTGMCLTIIRKPHQLVFVLVEEYNLFLV
jgi:hypothetical protein